MQRIRVGSIRNVITLGIFLGRSVLQDIRLRFSGIGAGCERVNSGSPFRDERRKAGFDVLRLYEMSRRL